LKPPYDRTMPAHFVVAPVSAPGRGLKPDMEGLREAIGEVAPVSAPGRGLKRLSAR